MELKFLFNSKLLSITFLLLTSVFLFTACEKDDDDDEEEEVELITTLELTFDDGSTTQAFTFQDLDGDGGNAPSIDDITLSSNTTYNVSIRLANDSETPSEDITAEVMEEDLDHIFIFTPGAGLNLSAQITDQDSNGAPIGLSSQMVTLGASTGTLNVKLKHEADKSSPATTGETDIDVTFNVTIQ